MFYCFYVEYLYFCTKFNVKQKNLSKLFMEHFRSKRNIIGVSHNGSKVNLDVDRIIAIDCIRRELYFEFAAWCIDDAREFDTVWNAWLGYGEQGE